MGQYREFRADGWPYCPRCEDDELWAVAAMNYAGNGPAPAVAECVASGMKCYRCGWESREFKGA